MSGIKVKVTTQSTSSHLENSTIWIPELCMKKWRIPSSGRIVLRFGTITEEVSAIPVSHKDSILRLHPEISERFGLHHGAGIRMKYHADTQIISLGPIIGVMVSRVYPGNNERPFGAITSFCKELSEASERIGAFVYFFSPAQMIPGSSMLKGWVYVNGWQQKSLPFPHIIYNRLTSRKYESLPNVVEVLKEAKTLQHTEMFNEKYLNKNEVFDALRKENALHIYLPESHLLKNYQMLKAMSNRHQTLFLKPIRGSMGKGIIRIRKEEGAYTCHFTQLNGTTRQTFDTLPKLFASLAGKIKAQQYQIQEGLHLLTSGGRPMDFRALVQRGDKGEWAITSLVARIAGDQHFVSNLARGGSLSPVNSAIANSTLPASLRAAVLGKLRKAALDIAKGIAEQIPCHFAELGVDLAVDQGGKVWLIEVNSKPSKDENAPIISDKKIRPSIKQLLGYAKHLAKF
jgi:glutathione synthase/RimK-type ligase-like ATP-grasp enzyme